MTWRDWIDGPHRREAGGSAGVVRLVVVIVVLGFELAFGLVGLVFQAQGLGGLSEDLHRMFPVAGMLAGFLEFGDGFLVLVQADEALAEVKAEVEVGGVLRDALPGEDFVGVVGRGGHGSV